MKRTNTIFAQVRKDAYFRQRFITVKGKVKIAKGDNKPKQGEFSKNDKFILDCF
jgi:hypothetical protein